MGNLQSPFVNWAIKAQFSKAGFDEHRVLLIAQSAGTATELVEDVQMSEIDTLCGNSLATLAYKRFRDHNKATEVDILPLAEPAGATKSQGAIKITGTATESKTLKLRVGDDEHRVSVTVVKGETETQVSQKVRDAINATDYPYTATLDGNDASLVLLEYKFAGEIGNGLVTTFDTRVNGITTTQTVFTGGAGAYETAGILDGLTKRYHTVIFDEAANFDDIETWLQGRINPENTVLGGIGLKVKNDTRANLKTFVQGKNSQTMVVIGNADEMKYNMTPILGAAEIGAKRALRLTSGAIIADLVLDAEEAYGGVNKASLPYHNTPMSYQKPKGLLTLDKLKDLNDGGISFIVPATIGTVLGEMKTLYKVDLSGQEDVTFRFLNAVDTSFAVQEYLFVNTKKRFGQTRATKGDLLAGVSMSNPLSVKAYIVGLYEDMVQMALVQGGTDAEKAFKRTLTVDLDTASGVYTVYAPVAIVSQFRGLNGTVAIGYNFS